MSYPSEVISFPANMLDGSNTECTGTLKLRWEQK